MGDLQQMRQKLQAMLKGSRQDPTPIPNSPAVFSGNGMPISGGGTLSIKVPPNMILPPVVYGGGGMPVPPILPSRPSGAGFSVAPAPPLLGGADLARTMMMSQSTFNAANLSQNPGIQTFSNGPRVDTRPPPPSGAFNPLGDSQFVTNLYKPPMQGDVTTHVPQPYALTAQRNFGNPLMIHHAPGVDGLNLIMPNQK